MSDKALPTADALPPIPTTCAETLRALFSHASPLLLSGLVLGLTVFRLYLGNWQWADLLAPILIVVLWPLLEWLIHVHLLHARPRKLFGRTLDLRVSRVHRAHHQDPSDLRDITINLEVFPTVVPALIALAYWLFPSAELATGALATFFLMALHYEWCHFVAHVRWCPPLAYYRRRQHHHRLHHYRDERLWWGVSTGLGDVLLGTAPDGKSVPRSETVHDVHGLAGR